MFHKFLGFGHRALKPVLIDNNPNRGSQFLWADAVFVRDLETIDQLRPVQILKLGILAYLYSSPDVAFYCIRNYDERQGTDFLKRLIALSSSR